MTKTKLENLKWNLSLAGHLFKMACQEAKYNLMAMLNVQQEPRNDVKQGPTEFLKINMEYYQKAIQKVETLFTKAESIIEVIDYDESKDTKSEGCKQYFLSVFYDGYSLYVCENYNIANNEKCKGCPHEQVKNNESRILRKVSQAIYDMDSSKKAVLALLKKYEADGVNVTDFQQQFEQLEQNRKQIMKKIYDYNYISDEKIQVNPGKTSRVIPSLTTTLLMQQKNVNRR